LSWSQTSKLADRSENIYCLEPPLTHQWTLGKRLRFQSSKCHSLTIQRRSGSGMNICSPPCRMPLLTHPEVCDSSSWSLHKVYVFTPISHMRVHLLTFTASIRSNRVGCVPCPYLPSISSYSDLFRFMRHAEFIFCCLQAVCVFEKIELC